MTVVQATPQSTTNDQTASNVVNTKTMSNSEIQSKASATIASSTDNTANTSSANNANSSSTSASTVTNSDASSATSSAATPKTTDASTSVDNGYNRPAPSTTSSSATNNATTSSVKLPSDMKQIEPNDDSALTAQPYANINVIHPTNQNVTNGDNYQVAHVENIPNDAQMHIYVPWGSKLANNQDGQVTVKLQSGYDLITYNYNNTNQMVTINHQNTATHTSSTVSFKSPYNASCDMSQNIDVSNGQIGDFLPLEIYTTPNTVQFYINSQGDGQNAPTKVYEVERQSNMTRQTLTVDVQGIYDGLKDQDGDRNDGNYNLSICTKPSKTDKVSTCEATDLYPATPTVIYGTNEPVDSGSTTGSTSSPSVNDKTDTTSAPTESSKAEHSNSASTTSSSSDEKPSTSTSSASRPTESKPATSDESNNSSTSGVTVSKPAATDNQVGSKPVTDTSSVNDTTDKKNVDATHVTTKDDSLTSSSTETKDTPADTTPVVNKQASKDVTPLYTDSDRPEYNESSHSDANQSESTDSNSSSENSSNTDTSDDNVKTTTDADSHNDETISGSADDKSDVKSDDKSSTASTDEKQVADQQATSVDDVKTTTKPASVPVIKGATVANNSHSGTGEVQSQSEVHRKVVRPYETTDARDIQKINTAKDVANQATTHEANDEADLPQTGENQSIIDVITGMAGIATASVVLKEKNK